MAEVKKELSDAEIAAKTGFGETAEATQEDTTETEEETETTEKEEKDEAEESEESEEGEKPARQKRDVSTEKEEESKESEDESEEEESEDEDKTTKSKDEKTVPYSLLKSERAKIKQLQSDLTSAQEALNKAKKSGDEADLEEATEEVEASAKELAEELGMDEGQVSKLLKAAVKLSSKKQALPKEIADKLKTLDELQKQNLDNKEVAHFNKEWESLDMKKMYPNAPKSALKEAQELMDSLAHSKDHHKHELDYILFKNKSKFDSLLKVAPKGKSGETTKRIGSDKGYEGNDDEENLVDIEDLNPSIMKERENKDLDMRRAHAKDKDYRIYNPRES